MSAENDQKDEAATVRSQLDAIQHQLLLLADQVQKIRDSLDRQNAIPKQVTGMVIPQVNRVRVAVVHPEPERETKPPVPVVSEWKDELEKIVHQILQPCSSVLDEVNLLTRSIVQEAWSRTFPNEVRVSLLAYCVARIRHLQSNGLPDSVAIPIIGSVGRCAKETQVGFVHGVARDALPKFGSWERDAEAKLEWLKKEAGVVQKAKITPTQETLLNNIRSVVEKAGSFEEIEPHVLAALDQGVQADDVRLVKLMAPFLSNLSQRARYKALRRAIRDAEIVVVDDPDAGKKNEQGLLSDWPWLAFTKGKRVIMVGGDSREENRAKIEKTFQFAKLEWEGMDSKPRQLQQVRDRVLAGHVDLVLLLRFIGHDTDQVIVPACKSTGTPFLFLPNGYGIDGIRQQIEQSIRQP